MYVDSQLLLSDEQAVTASATGTNIIDLSVDRSIGNGEPVAVVFSIIVAADTTTGDEDYTFDVEYASGAAQTGRELVGRRIFESTPSAPAQDAALLVEGFRVIVPVPPTTLDESARYIGVRYTLAGTTPSVTVSAFLQPMSMIDATNDYPNNYTISG